MNKTAIQFKDGLIGDFLGGAAAIYEFAKSHDVQLLIHPEAQKVADILEKNYEIVEWMDWLPDYVLDSSKAFELSIKNNTYMSQAYFQALNMPCPKHPLKAPISTLQEYEHRSGFIISPFARSLPPEQKVFRTVWQDFVDSHPDERFILMGNSKFDSPEYIIGPNVEPMFDMPFSLVVDEFKRSKGVISVVTGTSHLAFHTSTPNFLITNQNMAWGTNPEAIKLTKHIPDIIREDITELVYG